MVNKFEADYIEEPDLVFGGQREEKDPRIGLKYHGPYHYSSEPGPSPNKLRLGIVGTGNTITQTKNVLKKLQNEVMSESKNKWLNPNFLGFSSATSIRCDFVTNQNWEATIKDSEIKDVLNIPDVNRRIASGVNLFKEKVKVISLEDNKPDVIICCLPYDIEEYCGISEKTRGAKRPKFTALEKDIAELKRKNQTFLDEWGFGIETVKEKSDDKDLDFHNALKGKVMEFGIPIQILRESTATAILNYPDKTKRATQEPATFAWNFATALYYKANGKPWRLGKLRQDTCYVGVSFFHNLLNPNLEVETSMAQVFTHNGEGIVLRGSDVIVDEHTKEPHLSEQQAVDLLTQALATYKERAGHEPSRVVIHKTTLFSESEKNGFTKVIGNISKDYVTINERTSFRCLRIGSYPVLRGTVVYLAKNKCLLFTSGYSPRIRTYPGHRVPEPLLVMHFGDSQLYEICKEIMGLTKLNWNTTEFATQLPITLEFATKVGKILSELDEDRQLQNHYRFYM